MNMDYIQRVGNDLKYSIDIHFHKGESPNLIVNKIKIYLGNEMKYAEGSVKERLQKIQENCLDYLRQKVNALTNNFTVDIT